MGYSQISWRALGNGHTALSTRVCRESTHNPSSYLECPLASSEGRGDLKGAKGRINFVHKGRKREMICFPDFRGAAAGAAETPGGERAALGAVAGRLRRLQQLQAKEGRRDTGTERENRCDGLQGKRTHRVCFRFVRRQTHVCPFRSWKRTPPRGSLRSRATSSPVGLNYLRRRRKRLNCVKSARKAIWKGVDSRRSWKRPTW